MLETETGVSSQQKCHREGSRPFTEDVLSLGVQVLEQERRDV